MRRTPSPSVVPSQPDGSNRQKLVVLTGAGMSAESGIPTFRGADGLWEGHRVEDVATPQGWKRDPDLVLEFYNQRRKRVLEVEPNHGHWILAELEQYFSVTIITQNIDNLHERAGSSHVIHLHGLITQHVEATSLNTKNPQICIQIAGQNLSSNAKI